MNKNVKLIKFIYGKRNNSTWYTHIIVYGNLTPDLMTASVDILGLQFVNTITPSSNADLLSHNWDLIMECWCWTFPLPSTALAFTRQCFHSSLWINENKKQVWKNFSLQLYVNFFTPLKSVSHYLGSVARLDRGLLYRADNYPVPFTSDMAKTHSQVSGSLHLQSKQRSRRSSSSKGVQIAFPQGNATQWGVRRVNDSRELFSMQAFWIFRWARQQEKGRERGRGA